MDMEGCWDLSGLYNSPEDLHVEQDRRKASNLAGKLKRNPSQTLLYRRFSAVSEKLDTYAYLLSSVNLNNPKILEFCRELRTYTAGLKRTISAADPGEKGISAVCQEYDRILAGPNLQPGRTRMLYHGDEETRRGAYRALEQGWRNLGGTVTELYNRRLSEISCGSRFREKGFTQSDAAELMSAVERQTSLPEQFYLRKARILGKEQLEPWDIFAPILPSRSIPWEQATKYAVDTADMLGPALSRTGKRFFKNHWVDYSIRPEKRGGAFTHPAFPSHHPYIFLNFSGSLRDTLTLIHELFHGIHYFMAGRRRGGRILPSAAQSEAVSAVGELMALETLNEQGISDHLAEILVLKLYRQVFLFQWEKAAETLFREKGRCPQEELSTLWFETNRRYFGESFSVPDSYRGFWIYVPHIFHFPFYGMNYALGTAAALVFMKLYRKSPLRAGRLFRKILTDGGDTPLSGWIGRLAPGRSPREVFAESLDQVKWAENPLD